MEQKDKELLLKDFCTRLPYKVKCNIGEETSYTLCRVKVDDINGHLLDFIETKDGLDMQVYLSEVKPYLFPLLSMTKEQRKEYYAMVKYNVTSNDSAKLIDWLNKNHFDYRGLIAKGLAIDCTNLNIY